MSNIIKKLIPYILSFCLVLWLLSLFPTTNNKLPTTDELETLSYTEFLTDVDDRKVSTIYYVKTNSVIYVETNDMNFYKITNPEYDDFKKEMLEKGISVQSISELPLTTSNGEFNWFHLIMIGATVLLLMSLANFTRKNKMPPVSTEPNLSIPVIEPEKVKKFKDIAGHTEVKRDVATYVDFLKNRNKYTRAGAKLPKGVLFYGPPGTGKTLLAKAIAGEAGVSFIHASGSDFMEMYVGVGAKRIRGLFQEARKRAPCIIFIDEIDAIGSRRSTSDSSNGESRQTINALLTEMDGFKSSENILVIAATNRLEDLDKALTRSGRFDDKVCVPLPSTPKERLAIIKMYAKNKRFAEDVDFNALSKETVGFSPADIESLLNSAAIIQVQEYMPCITRAIIDKAMFKAIMDGHLKESQEDRSKEELEITAWHEAGHAVMDKLNGDNVTRVTILSSTSGAGGVTFSVPDDMSYYSVDDLRKRVMALYAGRVAEMLLFGEKTKTTTGASNDIEKATNIIEKMVTAYGMSDEFGLLNLSQLKVSKDVIFEKEIEIAKELETETKRVLTENIHLVRAIAEGLLEYNTLYADDLERIFNPKPEIVELETEDILNGNSVCA